MEVDDENENYECFFANVILKLKEKKTFDWTFLQLH